jgi:hypothetical protein
MELTVMMTPQHNWEGNGAILHVFPQDGVWNWGITVPRANGGGFRVVAYNTKSFYQEHDAIADGGKALKEFNSHFRAQPAAVTEKLSADVVDYRRQYMRERLRCAIKRLMSADETNSAAATPWVTAWSAMLGEQYFDQAPRRKRQVQD